MSYWVYLEDKNGEAINFGRCLDLRGGSYAVGGTTEAELNVTYNYSTHIRAALHPDGLRWLHQKNVEMTIIELRRAVMTMTGERSNNYWDATEGNARAALRDLLTMAEASPPSAIWRVS